MKVYYLSMKILPGSAVLVGDGKVPAPRDLGIPGCVGLVLAFDSEEAAKKCNSEAGTMEVADTPPDGGA